MIQPVVVAQPKSNLARAAASPLVLALVIFGLALGPRLLDLDIFVGPDEFTWDTRSANFARALAGGDLAETYQDGYPGVTLMWVETLGAWLRYGWQALNGRADWDGIIGPEKSMAMLSSKRQVMAVTNALLLALYAGLAARLFGPRVAWLTGFLLAFDPFVLTESRLLRSEGIMTGMVSLALLALLLYLRRPRSGYAALAGALAGLAVLSKVSAAALLPVSGLIIGVAPLLNRAGRPAQRWRTAVMMAAAWGLALLLAIWLLWPALWLGPIEVAAKVYDYVGVRVTEGNEGGASFFLGQPRADEEIGPLFYPVALLYRTGPLLWLGLALLLLSVRRLARPDRLILGVMLLYLAVYLAMISSSTLKYDRFIIPMLPALTLMAALGMVTTWEALAAGRWPGLARWGWLLALLVLAGQMALALPHHPYYYTYWNPLLGGLKQAMTKLPVGEGEGLDRVAAYLNALPEADRLKLASASSQKIRPILRGETIALANLDGKWVQGDYVLIYISQLQRAKHDPYILAYLRRRPPVYTVNFWGVEYAWLYPGPAARYYGGGFTLEGRGTLYGYDLAQTELAAGDELPVTLYWRNEGQQEGDLFFVWLVDLDGYTWSEAIAQPRPAFEAAARERESILESEAVLSLPVGMPPGDYFFQPGFRRTDGEIIGYFESVETKPIRVTRAGSYPPPGSFQAPQPARLTANRELSLAGYHLAADVLSPGAETWLTLYWQALADLTRDYVVLVRLVGDGDHELAYWLGRPVRSGYPTTGWLAGQVVQDPWRLLIPAEAGPGAYTLEIALFDAETEAEVARQSVGQITIK